MVDIVVPIYNAIDYVQDCVESVLRHSSTDFRLILIDDKSPDPIIWEYLQGIDHPNVVVLQNDENRGTIFSENRGIQLSEENDIIILNSDTVVTARWIEKLRACAYSDDQIGCVVPLTTNGAIFSVPRFCEDNLLPEGLTADHFGKLIEKVCIKESITVPLGVSFCMYVKREVFRKIGVLDYETYDRGYYEENDFCFRAAEAGYSTVQCNNTFVYHKGAVSFKESRSELEEAHAKICLERHPKMPELVHNHVYGLTWAANIENIRFHLRFQNGKNNVLFLTDEHYNLPYIPDCNFYTLRTEGHFAILGINTVFTLRFYLDRENLPHVIKSKEYAYILKQIIVGFNIDTTIVSHLKGHTTDIFDLCAKYNVKIIAHLCDYYYLFPTGDPKDSPETTCKKLGYGGDFCKVWRTIMLPLLGRFDSIVSNEKPILESYLQEDLKIESLYVLARPRELTDDTFNPRFLFDAFIKEPGNVIHSYLENRYVGELQVGLNQYIDFLRGDHYLHAKSSQPIIPKRSFPYRVARAIYRRTLKRLITKS